MKAEILLGKDSKVTRENFPQAMQQAIGIEIATIPVYLYTYYSIRRAPDQGALQNQIAADLKAAKQSQEPAAELAAKLMVFANKAGALVMSIAIEEMLHMSLASNVMQSIVGKTPQLVGQAPNKWPAYLPGHIPEFRIDRAALSLRQLYTFLQIETPHQLPTLLKGAEEKPIEYTTIGEFYDQIEKYIKSLNDKKDFHPDRPQLIPGQGYYTNNTIDTVYYNKKHKPRFVNAEDSGDLVHVKDKKSAIKALTEIVEQGEGYDPKGLRKGLNKNGTINCSKPNAADYDDPSEKELSHFEKFNDLYCEFHKVKNEFAKAFGKKIDNNPPDLDKNLKGVFNPDEYLHPEADEWFTQYFVYKSPLNPATANYPEPAQQVSNLTNAIYSYLFIMSEECYKKEGNTQYEIFMFGIHKSMIFILSSLCEEMRAFTYHGEDGKEYNCAATFEEYRFSAASSPKSQILELFATASKAYSNISYIAERLSDLPDVPLEPYLNQNTSPTRFA